jgi:GNAT superfamily N-acetyltransferase
MDSSIKDNFQRLVQLADEVFAYKDDPDQLNVNPRVLDKLHQMHPLTLSDYSDEGGPVVWLLVIPTTTALMHRFLIKEISEKELFELTPLNIKYDALYLCSALVLEEYRRKGITLRLLLEAIEAIKRDHPLESLFVWPFTKEGNKLAEKVAQLTQMPLYKRLD